MPITKNVSLDNGKMVELRATTPGNRVLMSGKGDKVVCATHDAGYLGQQEDVKRLLVVGREYVVDAVDVGSGMSSVWLEEFPGRGFNSVFFRTPEDYRKMTNVLIVADIVEKNDRTIRQNNLEVQHRIPLGALVEAEVIDDRDRGSYDWEGIRLYVVDHQRDCDGTPLYGLGAKGCTNRYMMMFNGFSEESLKVIRNPDGSTPGKV